LENAGAEIPPRNILFEGKASSRRYWPAPTKPRLMVTMWVGGWMDSQIDRLAERRIGGQTVLLFESSIHAITV
jgi:hypothetical protein